MRVKCNEFLKDSAYYKSLKSGISVKTISRLVTFEVVQAVNSSHCLFLPRDEQLTVIYKLPGSVRHKFSKFSVQAYSLHGFGRNFFK